VGFHTNVNVLAEKAHEAGREAVEAEAKKLRSRPLLVSVFCTHCRGEEKPEAFSNRETQAVFRAHDSCRGQIIGIYKFCRSCGKQFSLRGYKNRNKDYARLNIKKGWATLSNCPNCLAGNSPVIKAIKARRNELARWWHSPEAAAVYWRAADPIIAKDNEPAVRAEVYEQLKRMRKSFVKT